MFYEPKNGHGLPHDPFRNIVAPRPIGWISTISEDGHVNLAPYSFFNAFCGAPPIVGFASEGMKDSQTNARATREFVVNLATRRMADAMNMTSSVVGHEIDEFELAGLEPAACRLVTPPRVKGAPAALECRVTAEFPLEDLDGRNTDRALVVGQVVGIHIEDAYITDGLFDIIKAGTISRLGYRDYAQVTEVFSILPPKSVLDH